MTLTPIRAAKENDLDWNIAALYALRPMFFAYYHSNYARYVLVYLMTSMNLSDTHPGCKELLETIDLVCQGHQYHALEMLLTSLWSKQ